MYLFKWIPLKCGFSGKKATGQTFSHCSNEKFSNSTRKENLSNHVFSVLLKSFLLALEMTEEAL